MDTANSRAETNGRGNLIQIAELAISTLRESEDVFRIAPSGELDIASADRFEQELEALEAMRPSRVIIDLRALTFIDSSGIRALASAVKRYGANGTRLEVRRELTPAVKRAFELTGMTERLPFAEE
jgi:anti-anti-sigma factor